MGKYNNKLKYNATLQEGGIGYNYLQFQIIIKVFETLNAVDNVSHLSVQNLIKDVIKIKDSATTLVELEQEDWLEMQDALSLALLINVLDKININDSTIESWVDLVVEDNRNAIGDRVNGLAELVQSEEFKLNENVNLETLLKTIEDFKLKETNFSTVNLALNDRVKITDKDTRVATSDFYIGKTDDLDNRYDWLIPFNMLIDKGKSSIQIMPATEKEAISMPAVDGTITQNTVYQNRLFNIVAYSMDGMNEDEKNQIMQNIVKLLDTTKQESKTLTFGGSDTTFDVTYEGEADIREYGTSVYAQIPFSAQPYGRKSFSELIYGEGIINNDGDTNLGVKVQISGGCVNPHFKIDDTEFLWNGTVPNNKKLIIDNEDTTCYLIDEWGVQSQALDKLTRGSDFITIPKGEQAVVVALNESTKDSLFVEYSPLILWYGKKG